ncbi:hypothetical protein [Fuerstiella marisgermanici]|uniref:R.HinP1I restriction endonuclease n=1 Tax=Fuerstiella marisgermanici TaxID=1891926 RepID=A0A1P8WL34_9PLAN|nr:hypothetical protein [Fuerstiella marisgermanici]APZ94755.1 R.HinP1I restriction endonuclease [Fuerstiella marisgermanici]
MMADTSKIRLRILVTAGRVSLAVLILCCFLERSFGQKSAPSATETTTVERGSKTAKDGFKNEDDIRDRFNNWKQDDNAKAWLKAMNYRIADIENVNAVKPHGYKADVEVTVKTAKAIQVERISIKLVSSANGFNQIDKRWLATYAKMWKMPPVVVKGLKYFVGETPPYKASRRDERMYLNELPEETQKAVLKFFASHKKQIVSDLLEGDGEHRANWFMVTFKGSDKPQWLIKPTADAVRFFSEGDVVMTRAGNLKIGRIGVQRKGGDNGRETAKMLQFKINPVQLFDAE